MQLRNGVLRVTVRIIECQHWKLRSFDGGILIGNALRAGRGRQNLAPTFDGLVLDYRALAQSR